MHLVIQIQYTCLKFPITDVAIWEEEKPLVFPLPVPVATIMHALIPYGAEQILPGVRKEVYRP